MAKPTQFRAGQVTDAKRIARGEQYRYAAGLLRSQTPMPSPRFRAICVAGQSVAEDVASLRAAFARIEVTVVDVDDAALEFAMALKDVRAVRCDVHAIRPPRQAVAERQEDGRWLVLAPDGLVYEAKLGVDEQSARRCADAMNRHRPGRVVLGPPDELAEYSSTGARVRWADLVNLDMNGIADEQFRRTLDIYSRQLVRARGILMATFSYGRDAAPFYASLAMRGKGFDPRSRMEFNPDITASLWGRIEFLTPGNSIIESVVVYPGNAMPMCSVLWMSGARARSNEAERSERFSFMNVRDVNLSEVVSTPIDVAALYATPEARVRALRATRTRALKAAPVEPPTMIGAEESAIDG